MDVGERPQTSAFKLLQRPRAASFKRIECSFQSVQKIKPVHLVAGTRAEQVKLRCQRRIAA